MRKIAIVILMVILSCSCGKNKSTGSDEGIKVTVSPYRIEVELDGAFQFAATVTGTGNHWVTWLVQGIVGGNTTYGTIDSTGLYRAPSNRPGQDSVEVTARSDADLSRDGHAWAILVNPNVRYVSTSGSDQTGSGSKFSPLRTISKGLQSARSGQTIMIGAGTYDVAVGESFPLRVPVGISLNGAGPESTFVVGPGGRDPYRHAVIEISGDAITVGNLQVKSADGNGIGILLRPGFLTTLQGNYITQNYIGVYVAGRALPRPMVAGCRIMEDSIGIVTADSSQPVIRGCYIYGCRVYGINIRDQSKPDLGVNASGYAGHDTVRQCGDYQYHYLIYNGSPQTISAMGNIWELPYPPDNDQLIYDDEESGGASGDVILMEP